MRTLRNSLVLIVLATLLVTGLGTVPAVVAQETGGLPALTAQVQALQTTVTALQAANTTLQATVASLQSSNTTLQNALNAEIGARVTGDTTLQTALNLEVTQRSAAVAGGQSALASETANRISGDQHLQDLITPLQTSGPPAGFIGQGGSYGLNNNFAIAVAHVAVPPGHYLITAVIPLENNDSADQRTSCGLYLDNPTHTNPTPLFNQTGPAAAGASQGTLAGSYAAGWSEQTTLLAVTNLTSPETLLVLCNGYNVKAEFALIVATQIGEIH
jgi:hypothetical protein